MMAAAGGQTLVKQCLEEIFYFQDNTAHELLYHSTSSVDDTCPNTLPLLGCWPNTGLAGEQPKAVIKSKEETVTTEPFSVNDALLEVLYKVMAQNCSSHHHIVFLSSPSAIKQNEQTLETCFTLSQKSL